MMNPFNPSFGKLPQIFLDRTEQIESFINELQNPDSPYQTSMIYGQRGSGKSSFMTAVIEHLEKMDNFLVIKVPSSKNILMSCTQAIYDKSRKKISKIFDALEGLHISAFHFEFGYEKKESPSVNYLHDLEEMLMKLNERHVIVTICLDEVKESNDLIDFIEVYSILMEKNYPVRLIMAGLPQNISEIQNNDNLTFLLRAPRISLKNLDPSSVKYAYQKAFENTGKIINHDSLMLMVKNVGGYAYAFQLLGYLVWKNTEQIILKRDVIAILDEYRALLYRNAYTKIFESVSQKDKEFLIAMAKDDSSSVPMKNISSLMNKSDRYVSVYRIRLIDAQIIEATSYGHVGFLLPSFKDFVLERAELFFD